MAKRSLPLVTVGDEVGEALALDRGDDSPLLVGDGVVAGRQRSSHGRRLLMAEVPGVTLVGVDDDLERSAGAGRRQRHVGPGLLGGAGALPEDHLAATRLGEHELRSVLSAAIEHEVDRRAAAGARPHRDAFDDLRFVGPSSARWQYSFVVRGQTSRTLSVTGPLPSGCCTRNGSDESGSGLRATTNSTPDDDRSGERPPLGPRAPRTEGARRPVRPTRPPPAQPRPQDAVARHGAVPVPQSRRCRRRRRDRADLRGDCAVRRHVRRGAPVRHQRRVVAAGAGDRSSTS